MQGDTGRDVGSGWVRAAGYAVAVAGGWFLGFRVVEPQAEHDPWGVGFVLAVVVGAGVLLYRWLDGRVSRLRLAERIRSGSYVAPDDPRFRAQVGWVVPGIIVAVLCFYGLTVGAGAHNGIISDYCEYGATSDEQLAQCMSHVSSDYINGLDTQAARFGRGETSECLADSGPFCEAASEYNTADPEPSY